MACRFEYNGKTYDQDGLAKALEQMPPHEAHKYIDGIKNIPNAPFKKSWHELALKRMIREAAEGGYSRLSWTPGEAQAARYDLSKQIDSLHYSPKLQYLIGKKDGKIIVSQDNVTPDKLSDIVGKEAAKNLLADKNTRSKGTFNQFHKLSGQDLKIGGEGMKGFYDQIIPKALEKISGEKVKTANLQTAKIHELDKKLKENGYDPDSVDLQHILEDHGGRLPFWLSSSEADAIGAGEHGSFHGRETHKVHYIDLPQELKNKVLGKGFPLFSSTHMFTPVAGNPFQQDKK